MAILLICVVPLLLWPARSWADTASNYRAAVLGDRPVSYWRLADTSGTTAKDEMGANPGIIGGGPTLNQPGPMSGDASMAFNGAQWIDPGGNTSLASANVWSIELWFKASSSQAANCQANPGGSGICVLYTAGSNFGIALDLDPSGQLEGIMWADSCCTRYDIKSPRSYADGVWHYAALVHDSASLTMYVDGTAVTSNGSTSASTYYCCSPAGGMIANNAACCHDAGLSGSESEVAYYDYGLSATQVAAHYAAADRAPPEPPQADCYDNVYGGQADAADTYGTADICAEDLRAAGYAATSNHNATASDALDRSARDSVFFFAGHSACSALKVGGFLLFAGDNSFLGGTSADDCLRAFDFSGYGGVFEEFPLRLGARSILARFDGHADLVVLQACDTALDGSKGNLSAEGIGTQLFAAGARAVVGFTKEVNWGHSNDPVGYWLGRAWTKGFFDALWSGSSISEAVQVGVEFEQAVEQDVNTPADIGYQWSDIKILGDQGALPVVSTRARAQSSIAAVTAVGGGRLAGIQLQRLDRVLRRFLHRRVPKGVKWIAGAGPVGPQYNLRIPGIGFFVVNGAKTYVTSAAFDLPSRARRQVASRRAARALALAFASRHTRERVSDWALRRDGLTGGPRGQRDFEWQARTDGVWIPSYVGVSVRRDGSVAAYTFASTPVKVSVVPHISRARAVAIARRIGGATRTAPIKAVTLGVELLPHGQRLGWVIAVAPPASPLVLADRIVLVDARTGAARLLAA